MSSSRPDPAEIDPAVISGSQRPAEDEADDRDLGGVIIRGGLLRIIAFGYSAAVAVVATSVISRTVGTEGFADYATALSLIVVATALSDIGLLGLGLREFASLDGDARTRSLRALITLRFLLSAAAGLSVVAFAILSGYPSDVVAGLSLAGVGLCFMSLHTSYVVPIQATFRLNVVAALEALRQTLLMGMMIVAALSVGDVGAVISMYLPAGVLIALATGPYSRRIASIVPSFDLVEMRLLLRHVGAFAVTATVSSTYAFLAQITSNAVLGAEESGLFALAFRVFAVLVAAGQTAMSGAFPLLVTASAQGDDLRYGYALRRLLQTAVLTGVGCAVAMVAGATTITNLIGGSDYAAAQGVVRLIAIAVPASFVVTAAGMALLAARRHVHLVVITLLGAGSSILATAVLASRFGVYGAGAGIVLGEAVLATGLLWGVRQVSDVAMPRPGWALAVGALGVVCCVPVLISASGLLSAAIAASLFSTGILVFRLVPPELIEHASSLIKRGSSRTRP